jgi:hypothetical protein
MALDFDGLLPGLCFMLFIKDHILMEKKLQKSVYSLLNILAGLKMFMSSATISLHEIKMTF